MRFVAVKSETRQASAAVFKVRDLLVRQKTQIINALRGHMAEFGVVVPQGSTHVGTLIADVEDPHLRYRSQHAFRAWPLFPRCAC